MISMALNRHHRRFTSWLAGTAALLLCAQVFAAAILPCCLPETVQAALDENTHVHDMHAMSHDNQSLHSTHDMPHTVHDGAADSVDPALTDEQHSGWSHPGNVCDFCTLAHQGSFSALGISDFQMDPPGKTVFASSPRQTFQRLEAHWRPPA